MYACQALGWQSSAAEPSHRLPKKGNVKLKHHGTSYNFSNHLNMYRSQRERCTKTRSVQNDTDKTAQQNPQGTPRKEEHTEQRLKAKSAEAATPQPSIGTRDSFSCWCRSAAQATQCGWRHGDQTINHNNTTTKSNHADNNMESPKR